MGAVLRFAEGFAASLVSPKLLPQGSSTPTPDVTKNVSYSPC